MYSHLTRQQLLQQGLEINSPELLGFGPAFSPWQVCYCYSAARMLTVAIWKSEVLAGAEGGVRGEGLLNVSAAREQ